MAAAWTSRRSSAVSVLRELLKAVARGLLGRYEINRIYGCDLAKPPGVPSSDYPMRRVVVDEVGGAEHGAIRNRASYGGPGAVGFGLWEHGKLTCLCWFWDSTRYRDWKTWRIGEREAIMVDLLTVDGDRRRGLASALIAYAAAEMKRAGYERLYAWVWHSNLPSIRTFERAGWRWLALVIEVRPLGVGPLIRVARRRRGGRAA